jgi:hypothetical protein
MSYQPQIERLKKDSRELEYFMIKLQKLGNTHKAYIIQKKMEYLNSKIDEMKAVLSYWFY